MTEFKHKISVCSGARSEADTMAGVLAAVGMTAKQFRKTFRTIQPPAHADVLKYDNDTSTAVFLFVSATHVAAFTVTNISRSDSADIFAIGHAMRFFSVSAFVKTIQRVLGGDFVPGTVPTTAEAVKFYGDLAAP